MAVQVSVRMAMLKAVRYGYVKAVGVATDDREGARLYVATNRGCESDYY